MADAVEIKVLSGGAMQGLMTEVVPLFERANGHKVAVEFGLTSALRKAIENGAKFDLALLPRPDIDALARGGRIAAGTATDITRSAIGVAVRRGAPKPDIATVGAFKRTLQQARSITYSDGPSGLYIAGLLERLGLAAEVKPKTRLTTGPVAEPSPKARPRSAFSRSSPSSPSTAPSLSARCRASCKTSLSMPLGFLPVPPTAEARVPS